jgi:hypothetical protein
LRSEDALVPRSIEEIRNARANGKVFSGVEQPAQKRGLLGRCWDSVKGFTSKCRNFFLPKPKELPLAKVEELPPEKLEKLSSNHSSELLLRKDFGFDGEDECDYDRNFLSKSKSNHLDLHFMEACSDPSIMLAYLVLKLQERGSDNCEKAFRAWLKYNEKSKALAQEKHALALQNLEIEKNNAKSTSWLKIGCQGLGVLGMAAGAIAGFASGGLIPAAACAAAGVASTVIGKVMNVVTKAEEPVTQLVNLKANNTIGTNREKVEQLSMEVNFLQNQASMTAQDLVRLYQMNSTLASISQAIFQDRKERLQSTRIG